MNLVEELSGDIIRYSTISTVNQNFITEQVGLMLAGMGASVNVFRMVIISLFM